MSKLQSKASRFTKTKACSLCLENLPASELALCRHAFISFFGNQQKQPAARSNPNRCRLLNGPQGKRLPLFEPRIPEINELQSTLVTRTHKRLVFAELQGVERASIFRKNDPNDDAMLILLLIDGKNFCWNACHSGSFNCDFYGISRTVTEYVFVSFLQE